MAAASIAAFFIVGTVAVVGLAGKARQVLVPAVGSSHTAVVRYAILLIGGVTILFLLLSRPSTSGTISGSNPARWAA